MRGSEMARLARSFLCLFLFGATISLIPTLRAQTPTAEITGTITDSSGAAVPAAAIRLIHTATNTRRSVSSNDAGVYDLPALPPGVYQLRIEKPGFSSEMRDGIELQVGQVARADFALKVGRVSEVVQA